MLKIAAGIWKVQAVVIPFYTYWSNRLFTCYCAVLNEEFCERVFLIRFSRFTLSLSYVFHPKKP